MSRWSRWSGFLLLMMPACAGDEATGPAGPALRIIAGADLTDTISTTPAQGLVVQVLGANGRPEAGVDVRFEVGPGDFSRINVATVSQVGFGAVAGATTDLDGRAAVRIRMGTLSGDAAVVISVPLYALSDTARYTVLPGAPVRAALTPRDTVVTPGTAFAYRGSTVDRANNPRLDSATFEVVGTSVRMDSVGKITGVSVGRSTVLVRANIGGTEFMDSGTVLVVPEARIAWVAPSAALMLIDLNGENVRTLANPPAAAPAWAPSGARLVYARAGVLALVDLSGNVTLLETPGASNATWPEFSSDGQWIYFQAQQNFTNKVFRIRPDGSDMEFLGPLTGTGRMPTPSPDGRSVAWVTGANELLIHDLADGSARTVPGATRVEAPRWSPDGEWIAYTTLFIGELMLVRPDGTGLHRIGEHGLFAGFGWSRDSKWIIGFERWTTLVDVGLGQMTYLHWFGRTPAWQP